VAFDLRGMGESDKPDSAYDFLEFSGDLAFVMDDLGLSEVTLVGWSMGCSVSLELLRSHDSGRVSKLVLVNGPIVLTSTDDFPFSMPNSQLERYLSDMSDCWPAKEKDFIRETFIEPNEDLVSWLYGIALQTPLEIALRACRQQSLLDFRAFLKQITIPTLAIYGRSDPYYPVELGSFIAENAPIGRNVTFEKSGHYPFIEETEAFCSLIEAFARADDDSPLG